jgi:hypothetical protein
VKLRKVVSVGIQLGGNSRIVCDMVVSDLAELFLVTAGGHRCINPLHEKSVARRNATGSTTAGGRLPFAR